MDEGRTPAASKAESENRNDGPQMEELNTYLDGQREKGLMDIKFFTRNTGDSTVEGFAAEVNEMLKAREVPIQEPL